jgi:hypothetical protein
MQVTQPPDGRLLVLIGSGHPDFAKLRDRLLRAGAKLPGKKATNKPKPKKKNHHDYFYEDK